MQRRRVYPAFVPAQPYPLTPDPVALGWLAAVLILILGIVASSSC